MTRKLLLYCLIFFFAGTSLVHGKPFSTDSLTAILKKTGSHTHKRDLVLYLRYAFGDMSLKELDTAKQQADQLLHSYHEIDAGGISDFVNAICELRKAHYPKAQNSLLKAIEEANRYDDRYLLYACFTHLAFIQTDEGDVIAAISSFREAKREATTLNDAYLQVLIDINLSDIYYRNGMFSHALFYLNEAQGLVASDHIVSQRIENSIHYNKAEVFFRNQNIDSLRVYNKVLDQATSGSGGLHTFQKRTGYYIRFLQKQYPEVISSIKTLERDSLYKFAIEDKLCLADAYFQAGMLDSAKSVAEGLIRNAELQNHSERNLHLYKLLGDIADKNGDYKAAANEYKNAFSQTWEQLRRLINVGSVSSQIKIDQVQNSYALRAETYKRERLWLIFVITAISLFIIIGALLYYNVNRKKYYEKLLFESQKNEIAFINSHEVRRHSSNIMGIMQVINDSEHKYESFVEAEQYLADELKNLDGAIKNMSNKLSS